MWLMNLPAGVTHLLVVMPALKEAANKLVVQNYYTLNYHTIITTG
jgi:hypothetical protein